MLKKKKNIKSFDYYYFDALITIDNDQSSMFYVYINKKKQ